MRFRAQLHGKETLLRLLTSIERLGKTAYLVLSPTMIQLYLIPSMSNPLKMRIDVELSLLFNDVVLQSLTDNIIYMELDISYFASSIRSAQKIQDIIISLTKKGNFPFLSLQLKPSADIKIVQDIPVNIIGKDEFENSLVSPLADPADVQICLPPIKLFYNLIERYRNIGSSCLIAANMNGQMSVKVESMDANITTFFSQLVNPPMRNEQTVISDSGKIGEVTLDIRRFLKILSSYALTPQKVVACLFSKQALVLHVLSDGIYITYEIPHSEI
ncbi:putative Checkpoint protein HUS1 [Blattamonas nauphoetae]|uniref:Checkpoint protein n=1 Tax=Blattamonas nauphoetae TaxID=2049346 RepID=A0ABQ9YLR4_9EUKA|nr:putative Checkpoint protein HUS1 [Blattamonas nauphoetae]